MPHDIRRISHIVVHHSASRPTWDWNALHKLHLKRFRLYMGYHRLIVHDGVVYDGRRVQYRGAHCPPNANRLGVCVMGWNEGNIPSAEALKAGWTRQWQWTPAQHASLALTLRHLAEIHTDAAIVGHRQIAGKPTLCPGVDIPTWIEEHAPDLIPRL